MTAYPRGQAGSSTASEVNRVARFSARDAQDLNPDILTQVKREVDVLDLLEVSNNAAWVTRIAALPVRWRKLFEAGVYNRTRQRFLVYGFQVSSLSELLAELVMVNYTAAQPIIAWLRLSAVGTTVTGSGYSSVVDVLNSNPAVQGTDAQRPVNSTSANGLPIMNFTNDVLQWPLIAANNSDTIVSFGAHVQLTNLVGNKALYSVESPAASANKIFGMINGANIRSDAMVVDRHAQGGTLDTAWRFVTIEIDCAQVGEAAQVIFTIDGVVQVVGFSSGTPWPAGLGEPTGNMLIGARNAAGSGNPLVGSIGPNIYFFGRQLTPAERTVLMNFERPA